MFNAEYAVFQQTQSFFDRILEYSAVSPLTSHWVLVLSLNYHVVQWPHA